jgi:hypothetical protein
MSQSSPYARISLTLPPEVLAEADRLAAGLDRSRSWVIAEAIRRLASEGGVVPKNPPASDGSRLAQLRADMARSPEERVVAGERLAGAATGPSRGDRDHLFSFRSYHGYLRWDTQTGGQP